MKKRNRPRKIFAFDTEDNSKGVPYLYNFYDIKTGRHFTFERQSDALDFALSQSNSHFWAVNLEYDINNLFRGFYGLLEYCFAGSKMIFCEYTNQNIRFLDTLNHWKIGVKEMGIKIGLPKLEFKHRSKIKKATKKSIEYCKRDTEITGKFLKEMMTKYAKAGAEFRTTIAATTLHYFQDNFFGKVVHALSEEQIDFFHMGYFGGRTEIFFNSPICGKIFYHDINSLYPFCMREGVFPDDVVFYDDKTLDLTKEGMASVEIIAPENLKIPYLPARIDGKLYFPLGNWQGVYTNFELRQAVKLGYKIEKVYRAITFYDTIRPFKEYIDKMYKLRLKAQSEGDDLFSQVYKDLMNHLYGKFAQKNETTELLPLADIREKRDGDVVFGDLIFRKQKTKYPKFANCIWSCYVTAYARDLLYNSMLRVIELGGKLLYCDTDSVIYENDTQILENSKEIGKFKLECIYDYAHFKLPKLYCLKSNKELFYKAKGVPKDVRSDYFEKGIAEFRKPNKLRETLRRNRSTKRINKLIPNFWEIREKRVKSKYDKRIVLRSGNTLPVTLVDGKLETNEREKSNESSKRRNISIGKKANR